MSLEQASPKWSINYRVLGTLSAPLESPRMLLRPTWGWGLSPAVSFVLITLALTPAVVGLAPQTRSAAQSRRDQRPPSEVHPLHHISLEQLQAPTESVLRRLEDAIFNVGLLVVTDFSTGPSALAAFAHCAHEGHLHSNLKEVVLGDGSIRSTLATKTSGGIAYPLPGAAEQSCPELDTAARQLRAAVDHTGQAYARLLDMLMYGANGSSSTPGHTSSQHDEPSHEPDASITAAAGWEPQAAHAGEDAGPIASAALESESLEHFQLFHKHGPRSERPALELHSDMGLFIVMTAAEFFSTDDGAPLDRQDSGLRLELPGGQIVTPAVPHGSLLVMNGEGISRWMPAGRAGRQPYAPGHEVELPDGEGVARAWFGRMFFPPGRAQLQRSEPGAAAAAAAAGAPLTFAEYRAQTLSAFRRDLPHEVSAAGCSPARGQRLADEGSCGDDEIFCWMVCMQTSHLACGAQEAVCRNPMGLVWPDDFHEPSGGQIDHCSDCLPQCRGLPDAPDETSQTELCNTNLTAISMFMQGFQTTGRHHGPCLVFLFQQLPLTTWLRFTFACLGTFFMGVASGGLSWASRAAQRRIPAKLSRTSRDRLAAEALQAAVYAVRITLAYILMLIAMSYQVELFTMVIAGLVVGHWAFNIRSDEEDDIVDPCCC